LMVSQRCSSVITENDFAGMIQRSIGGRNVVRTDTAGPTIQPPAFQDSGSDVR
jgi:hypothetical protein